MPRQTLSRIASLLGASISIWCLVGGRQARDRFQIAYRPNVRQGRPDCKDVFVTEGGGRTDKTLGSQIAC